MKLLHFIAFVFASLVAAESPRVIDLGESTTERKVRRPDIEIIEAKSMQVENLRKLFEAKLLMFELEFTKTTESEVKP